MPVPLQPPNCLRKIDTLFIHAMITTKKVWDGPHCTVMHIIDILLPES